MKAGEHSSTARARRSHLSIAALLLGLVILGGGVSIAQEQPVKSGGPDGQRETAATDPVNPEADREGARGRPNVIIIVVDDMGWTDPASYGDPFHETPSIDRLAREGIRFTSAYAAAPNCSPTRASILTGKWPARLHLTNYLSGRKHTLVTGRVEEPRQVRALPPEEVTLAEVLRDAGYATGHVGRWHLGDFNASPRRQGFDFSAGRKVFLPREKDTTDRVTDTALDFIAKNHEGPFFLYLAYFALHEVVVKPELAARFEDKPGATGHIPGYAGMLVQLDANIGRILDRLEALEIAERTLIILTSDNGGMNAFSNFPLRSGKGSLYEGGIRVPTIVRGVGVTDPGGTRDTPVSSVDFFPTVIEVAGLPDSDHAADGRSLVPLLGKSGTLDREALYWHFPHYGSYGAHPSGAVRAGRYKLQEFYDDGHLELYDLSQDIGEQKNLAEAMPEKAASLRQMLRSWRRDVNAQMTRPGPDSAPSPGP